MKVLNSGLQDDIFHKAYGEFSRLCLTPGTDIGVAKDSFVRTRNLFIRKHRVEEFCDRTFELSEKLKEKGNTSLSSLFVSELGKTCRSFRLYEQAEALLNIAIENYQKSKDGLHELARLVDLEDMYKLLNYRRGLFDVLNRKKECCKRVIANYDENAAHFESVHIKPTPKTNVQVQLAFTYSTLAQMLERRKPENAIKLYQKAKNIYEELGREQEVAYLKKRLKDLQ